MGDTFATLDLSGNLQLSNHMRHAEKKYRQDKTNEIKHNEFLRLRQLKCELVTRTKALYYKKKLKECGNDSSKIYG